MNLSQAISKAGIVKEFRTFATPTTLTSEVFTWLRNHPKLKKMKIEWPKGVQYQRERWNCRATHGGKRPGPSRVSPVRVHHGRFAA